MDKNGDCTHAMKPFDYHPRTRIVFGPGSIDRLGALAAKLSVGRGLVVTDPGVCRAGHTDRAVASLTRHGVACRRFDEVRENPTTEDVDRALAVARDFGPDGIVGLGGGSAMDCAKGVNFLYTGGGRMEDYWGEGKARGPMLPAIGVPTTSGTGSEMQSFALISDPVTHRKMACGDRRAAFRLAVLDPELTLTQPPRVTALTGVDAVAHAVETHVTRRRNVVSQTFSREAWRLLSLHFPRVLEQPDDLAARSGMQIGAALAGLAIENSMLGAAHALANPLTARYAIPHGQAVGLMLPGVIRLNGPYVGRGYGELLEWIGTDRAAPNDDAGRLADFVADLVHSAGLAGRLSQLGVPRDALPDLAKDAARQWTGQFNPRDVGEEEFLDLYEKAY